MAKAQEFEMAQQEERLLRQLQQQGGGGEGEECGETSLNTPDEYTDDEEDYEDEDEVENEGLDECPEYGNFDLRRQCHNNSRYSHQRFQITLWPVYSVV